MATKTKTTSKLLLDRLKDLDRQTTGAYYEMGSLLSAIKHGRLYDRLGYDSLGHMIDKELSFTRSTAYRYLHVYRDFNRLGYTKPQALEILRQFGLTDLSRYLAAARQKVGIRAIRNQINRIKAEKKEMTFWIPAKDHPTVIRVLREHGCTVHDSGMLDGSSLAFLNLIRTASKSERPNLKLVSG